MPYIEHMILNQRNDGQEGKATTAFYTHTKCRWNQYPPPPPATASEKCFFYSFCQIHSNPNFYTQQYRDNNSKKCPPIEIISQHDTFANHFLHVLYFLKEGSTKRHDSTGFMARLWSCNKFLTKSHIQCATRYLTCRIHVILDSAETIFDHLRIYLGKYIVLCDLVSSGLI